MPIQTTIAGTLWIEHVPKSNYEDITTIQSVSITGKVKKTIVYIQQAKSAGLVGPISVIFQSTLSKIGHNLDCLDRSYLVLQISSFRCDFTFQNLLLMNLIH